MPCLDATVAGDNKYALGIMQFETRAVAHHAQAVGTVVELGSNGRAPWQEQICASPPSPGVGGNELAGARVSRVGAPLDTEGGA